MQLYRISMEWTKYWKAYREGDADFHTIVADMAEIPRSQAKDYKPWSVSMVWVKINYKLS